MKNLTLFFIAVTLIVGITSCKHSRVAQAQPVYQQPIPRGSYVVHYIDYLPGQNVPAAYEVPAQEAELLMQKVMASAQVVTDRPDHRNAIMKRGGGLIIFYVYNGQWVVERHDIIFWGLSYNTGFTRIHYY